MRGKRGEKEGSGGWGDAARKSSGLLETGGKESKRGNGLGVR